MRLDRRAFLTGTGAAALAATPTLAGPLSNFGLDAASFGVHPGSSADQSRVLQRAVNQAASTRVPLLLAPGVYRAGGLELRPGSSIVGVRGATRLLLTNATSLITAERADTISLAALVLDGGGLTLPEGRGCDGAVTGTSIEDAADTALFSRDGVGLLIANNVIRGSGNGGIRIWQTDPRRDGSSVIDNRIENTRAAAGGSGQNGNAINIFRAGNVTVRGNHIRAAAFSAIRGNAASNLQIVGNDCSALDEVAIYSEFGFEGAVIADNIVDGAGTGISVTNFKEGGRLAAVHGNAIRNIAARQPGTPPDEQGIGISVEADTAVTGNVIDTISNAGIAAGWGQYLRNVAVTGNIVRMAGYGITVSVASGAGDAVIADNLIAAARRGAIVGMEFRRVVTGDLAKAGAERYPQLSIAGNRVS
jgi:putative cofactor-binding repeat protein